MTPKVVIVTGASRGLGLAIAEYLLNASHNVVVAARSQDRLEALKKSYPNQVEYLAADLADLETAPKVAELAVKTFGRIDGVVINHGVLTPVSRMASASVEGWRKSFDINVFSGLALVQAALPELKKAHGCALWVSSGAASKAYTAWGAYGTSKAAVESISAHFALEEPEITSVAISPGRVDTDMQKLIRETGKNVMDDKDYTGFASAYEQGELLKPEQPAHVMARFVANPDRGLSGKAFKWQASELHAYQDSQKGVIKNLVTDS